MEKYKIFLRKSAADELGRLPKKDLLRIVERIQSLEQNPRPHGCEKLSAMERYRVRQGDYRIVYAVNDDEKTVDVVKIGHRREVYRQ
jgi:mRNA interferase RelE/StbE